MIVDGSKSASRSLGMRWSSFSSSTRCLRSFRTNSPSSSGFWRMATRHWRSGLAEYYRSLDKAAFVRDAQRLLPEFHAEDLRPGGSGVRAQALDGTGKLLDDFCIARQNNIIHVLNVPSPAATASLAIARYIIDLLELPQKPS